MSGNMHHPPTPTNHIHHTHTRARTRCSHTSNHCRATAVASRQLGLTPHVILRTSEATTADPGLLGNLVYERMVGGLHQPRLENMEGIVKYFFFFFLFFAKRDAIVDNFRLFRHFAFHVQRNVTRAAVKSVAFVLSRASMHILDRTHLWVCTCTLIPGGGTRPHGVLCFIMFHSVILCSTLCSHSHSFLNDTLIPGGGTRPHGVQG
jgi:hypothetical protein